jgi:4-hydroxy-tetrahydrodipicolinate synthase
MKKMINLFLSGNVLEAGRIQLELLPLLRSLGQNGRTNPVCLLKGAMAMVGYRHASPGCRLLRQLMMK